MITTLVTLIGIMSLPITIVIVALEVSYHFVKGRVLNKAKEFKDD